ncbi:MAG TPA: alginate lyase family protein, partial [Anaeromyxobacteraceae bacterium]
ASLRDFVSENPPGLGVQWASPMEAALRLVCAGQAHALLSGRRALAQPGYALDLVHVGVATARLILARLEDGQVVPNNHLVANHVGLLAAAVLLPEWPEAARWRTVAAAGLRREIVAQTHADGTSFEGSVPYHRLALELFTAGDLLARRAHVPLGERYASRLAALYAAARALLFTNGELPQLGDHDSGRLLAFRERPALQAGYLLPLGAAMTGDAALRVRPGAEDAEEALWLCGAAALERLLAAPPGPPPASASFPQGGFHLLRRGQAEVAVSCGRNGQDGVGGHSHNDKLAFELRLGGALVVCDPGSPIYTGDPALRDAFRATRAHATVVVDGAEQAPIPRGRPFALPDAARATCLDFASTARGERFVGEHRGYLGRGVIHRRELLLAEDALVVLDQLLGSGEHAIELRWPFADEEARLRPLAPEERRRLASLPEAGGARFDVEHAVEVGPAVAPRAALVVAAPAPFAPCLAPAGYASGYGELRPSRTAVFSGRITCPAALCTVFLPLIADGGASPLVLMNSGQ